MFSKLQFKNIFNLNIQQKQLDVTQTSSEFKSEMFMGNNVKLFIISTIFLKGFMVI